MAAGVGERLLRDPVDGSRDRGGRRPAGLAVDREVDVQPAGALSLDQSGDLVDAGQGRAVHLGVLAEEADDAIDLLDRLARKVLDRRDGLRRALAVALAQHARGPRLHQDRVEGVSGGVVELAGDPGALFGDDELVLAPSVVELVGDTGAEEPAPVTDQPRARPDEPREQVVRDRVRGDGDLDQHQRHPACGRGGEHRPRPPPPRTDRERVEGDRRRRRRVHAVGEGRQSEARRQRGQQHRAGVLVAPQQRERAQQHERERQAVGLGGDLCEVPEPTTEEELKHGERQHAPDHGEIDHRSRRADPGTSTWPQPTDAFAQRKPPARTDGSPPPGGARRPSPRRSPRARAETYVALIGPDSLGTSIDQLRQQGRCSRASPTRCSCIARR